MTDLIVEVEQAVAVELRVEVAVAELSVEGGIAGPAGTFPIPMTIRGTLNAGVGIVPFPVPFNQTIAMVIVAVATAPTGDDLIIDVLVNGISIFTTGFPTVLAGEVLSVPVTPTTTALVAGDIITVDIIQVGSVQPGAYATIVLVMA